MNVAELASHVRAVLAGDLTDAGEVREVAQQWSDLLTETMRRLDRASEWARRGLRTEALALAQMTPSIYEVAQCAQESSLAGWRDHCARHRLPRAPELPIDRLDQLTECHLQVDPLKDALARWRKLNIGRAAPTERLDQLRLLRRLDPANPIWTNDAPALERAALTEATDACERGLALWELDRVRSVLRWIEQGEWIEAPAAVAADAIRRRITELSGRSALERARTVVERLHQEYMAEAVDAAEAQLREWEALRTFLADSGVELPAELAASVQPVVEWLLERQEAAQRLVDHRSSVAELAAIIESPQTTLPSIESQLARVLSGPEAAPHLLVAAARRRVNSLRRARNVRRAVVVVVALALVAVLAVAAKTMLDRHAHRVAGERLLLAVQALIDKGDLEGARLWLSDQRDTEPLLLDHPAVSTAAQRVADASAAQVRRDAEFIGRLAEAGDPADPAANPALIEALTPLARTPSHRETLESWKLAHARAASLRQEQVDVAFARALAELERDIDRISTANDRDAEALLARAGDRLDDLERSPDVSTAAQLRARPLRVRLESLFGALEESRRQAQARTAEAAALGRLPMLIVDANAYTAALLTFADDFPDSVHSDAFRTTVIDVNAWRAVLAWPGASTPAIGRLAIAADGERADLKRQLKAHLDAFPASVHAAAARRALSHLESQNEWRRWLSNVVDGSPIFALRMVQLRNGDRYYYEASSAPQPTSDGQRVYRVVRQLSDPARGVFDGEYVRLDPRQIVADDESPQRHLAQSLRTALRGNELRGVDGALTVLKQLRDATNVNPVLRADLLIGMLQQMERAAPTLAPAFTGAEQRLAAFEPESLPWLDPRSVDARERAREIEAALPRVIEVDTWRDAWRKSIVETERLISERLEPAGMLLRNGDRMEVAAAGPLDPGPLVAIVVDGATARLVTIGTVDAARRATLDTATDALLSGTPIFRMSGGAIAAAPRSAPPSIPANDSPIRAPRGAP